MSLIKVNIEKYRVICHDIRRTKREEEFKPFDEIIMKQIPGNDHAQAEAARQAIRDKYASLQAQIDSAQTPEELKALLPQE
jgi:hypothetical protein